MSKRAVMAPATILIVSVLSVLGTAGAEEQEGKSRSGGKSAEVVKVDAEAGRITVKLAAAKESSQDSETLVAEGKALASLSDLKSGDKVVLACKEGTGQEPDGEGAGASTAAPCVVTDIEKMQDNK